MPCDAGLSALEVLAGCGRYARWLFDLAAPSLGARVVEVGAGIGTQSALLVASAPRREVLLTDADGARVAGLARRFAGAPNVACAPWRLPDEFPRPEFAPDSFVLWNVLEHVDDDVGALCRMHSALGPGGRVVVFAPAGRRLMSTFDRAAGHVRRYAARELADKARAAGFARACERKVDLLGAVGWYVAVRRRRTGGLPRGEARLFDRLVPVVRIWEDRLPVPFGLSVLCVAER